MTALVATLGIGIATFGDREPTPADPPAESHAGAFTGMVIRYTGDHSHDQPGDLVAELTRHG